MYRRSKYPTITTSKNREEMEYPFELSVLICTIPSRVENHLPKIVAQLNNQTKGKPVQVLYLGDNRRMPVGKKRNLLMNMVEGKYVCFIDDDDVIADDYIDTLLEAAKSDADCLLFDVSVSLNGGPYKICKYSIHYGSVDYPTHYERPPMHLTPVKTAHAKRIKFPEFYRAEDYGWAALLKPFLKTEHRIDKVLYYYNWFHATSATNGLDVAQ